MHTEHGYTPHIYMSGHTNSRQTYRALTQTQQKWPHLAPCTGWEGWRRVNGNLYHSYIDKYSVSPPSSWLHTLSLPSRCSCIPVSPVAGTWTQEPTRPQTHSSCWYQPAHMHTRIHHCPGLFTPTAIPLCSHIGAFTPRASLQTPTHTPASQATSPSSCLVQLHLH